MHRARVGVSLLHGDARLPRAARQAGGADVIDAALDFALAIGVTRAARQRGDTVVRKEIAIELVHDRVVDIEGVINDNYFCRRQE